MEEKISQSHDNVMHTKNDYPKKIRGIVKLIAFLLILCICFNFVYNVTKRKDAYKKMADFFSQEEDFDVLFFGSSHILNGVYPMQLWDDYGIISYNMGNHNEYLAGTYWNVQLALQETKPKLIVIDLFIIRLNSKYRDDKIEHIHNMLDAYPISYTKYLAVKDIFSKSNLIENTFEFLFNFSIYHSRWSELEEEDFENVITYEKGAESRIDIAIPNETSDFESVEMYNGEEKTNMKYLRKIIEDCQENGIEVLCIYLPFPASDINIEFSKYAEVICDEYDVNYINFLSMDVVNYNTDLYDESHLNPSGARKVTDYLGQYIMENYDIPDQRENEAYSFWYEDYDEYIDLKIENLKENANVLNNYVLLLYDEEDISYEIKVSSTLKIEEGSTLKYLLENLENNYEIDDEVFIDQEDKTIKITTCDNRTEEEIQTVWF